MSKDELQEQRIKRIDNIVSNVIDGFQNEADKINYRQLMGRKQNILIRLEEPNIEIVTASNFRLQLQEIDHSIRELEQKIGFNSHYDTSCDDQAARDFLKKYNLMDDVEDMVNSNDVLDKLEAELYNNKNDSDKT